VQKYLSLTKHIYNPQAVIMSKKSWDKLNAAEQKIIQDAAKEATAYQRQVSRKANDEGARRALKKGGMQVNDIAPAELARIREKVKPVVDKYSAQIGEPWVKGHERGAREDARQVAFSCARSGSRWPAPG
jgi:TRAP-type C4-dicarboxylate transport system substrate-binding protein